MFHFMTKKPHTPSTGSSQYPKGRSCGGGCKGTQFRILTSEASIRESSCVLENSLGPVDRTCFPALPAHWLGPQTPTGPLSVTLDSPFLYSFLDLGG